MSRINYSKELKMRVAKEALRPENNGLEHVIAAKYGIKASTVVNWLNCYLEYGEDAFKKGYGKAGKKTAREKELEKEVEELKQEVEILKKAAAFLVSVKHE